MRKHANIISVIALLVLVSGSFLVVGAKTSKSADEKTTASIVDLSKEDIPRLVEIIRIWKFVDELGLKEEQMLQSIPRFKELNDLRSNYYRNRGKTIDKLRGMISSSPSKAQLESAIGEYRNLRINYHQKEKVLEDKLYSGLSVEQQAKFIVFQSVYRRDMNNLQRELQKLGELRK